jgi:hypothetical protein
MSAVLLVRLKIPDLTAWTALDTARRLAPQGHEISRLVREELILFEPTLGAPPGPFEAALESAVDSSNFFVNPNKEQHRFLRASERGEALEPPEGSWGILSRSRGDTSDAGLLERLLREHPLDGLGAIRRGRLWWLWTRSPGGDPGAESWYTAVGPVESSGTGLLVNPHSEASLLMRGRSAWSRIESFLAEPAPALEPA